MALNPKSGRPLHLSNLKQRSYKARGGGRGGRSHLRNSSGLSDDDGNLCDVVISPSKELEEAEERGFLERKRGTAQIISVAAGGAQPRRQP